MEEMKELDSRGLVRELVKRAWIIVLCVAVGAIGALVFTKNFIKPTYKSGVTFYVNNNAGGATAENGNAGNSVGSENLAVALKLSKSYEVVIQKESVLEDIRKLAGLPVTGAEISKMISAEVIEETEIFQVDIVCKNKNMAYNIAKAIEEHAPGVIMKIIGGSKAEVVDAAKMPKGRFAPNYTTNTVARFIYTQGFETPNNFNIASAASVILFGIIVICSLILSAIMKERNVKGGKR